MHDCIVISRVGLDAVSYSAGEADQATTACFVAKLLLVVGDHGLGGVEVREHGTIVRFYAIASHRRAYALWLR